MPAQSLAKSETAGARLRPGSCPCFACSAKLMKKLADEETGNADAYFDRVPLTAS